jgi:hypothetical protein
MIRTDGEQLPGLIREQTVDAALAAISKVLQRALTAETDSQRRRELEQLHGVLQTLACSGLGLEGGLRHLIGALREPILER